MKYQITSDNVALSPSMKALAKSKLSSVETKLANIHSDLATARVVLNSAPEKTFEVKIEIIIGGKKYFATETDHTLESALVTTVEEIERQIEKFRGIIEKSWEKQSKFKRFPEGPA